MGGSDPSSGARRSTAKDMARDLSYLARAGTSGGPLTLGGALSDEVQKLDLLVAKGGLGLSVLALTGFVMASVTLDPPDPLQGPLLGLAVIAWFVVMHALVKRNIAAGFFHRISPFVEVTLPTLSLLIIYHGSGAAAALTHAVLRRAARS